MLEAKEVVKSFDGFRALDSATLTVPKGTVYGLVGPNGAGKSTIIRHFTGVYRPDSGQLLLEGAPIWENTDAKRRMVVIPDDWYYFPQASIAEMAKLYAGAYPSFSWERYEKMKQVFPLNDRQMLRRMSKGMQKQAAFWLTMCCMPEYLILDEPVDGLDPVMRRQVWSLLLGDVAERGAAGYHGEAAGGVPRRGAPPAGGAEYPAPLRRGPGAYLHPPGRPGEYPEPDADHRSPAAGGHSTDAGGDLYL